MHISNTSLANTQRAQYGPWYRESRSRLVDIAQVPKKPRLASRDQSDTTVPGFQSCMSIDKMPNHCKRRVGDRPLIHDIPQEPYV